MADMTKLVLGDVAFKDFEIPESITGFGGKHHYNVHKFIGGARLVDAMGADPDDPHWSGRFRGPDAVDRARAVEQYYISGEQTTLSWHTYFLPVVVAHFEPDFKRRYEIPYKIRCIVTEGGGGLGGLLGAFGLIGSLGSLLGSDLSLLSGETQALTGVNVTPNFSSYASSLVDGPV